MRPGLLSSFLVYSLRHTRLPDPLKGQYLHPGLEDDGWITGERLPSIIMVLRYAALQAAAPHLDACASPRCCEISRPNTMQPPFPGKGGSGGSAPKFSGRGYQGVTHVPPGEGGTGGGSSCWGGCWYQGVTCVPSHPGVTNCTVTAGSVVPAPSSSGRPIWTSLGWDRARRTPPSRCAMARSS